MNKTFRLISMACTLLLCSNLSFAEDWYQVEVIAFEYVHPNEDEIELWDSHPGEPDWKKGIYLTDEATAKARRKEELAKASPVSAAPNTPVQSAPDTDLPSQPVVPAGPEPLAYVALPTSQFTMQSVAAKLSKKDAYRVLSHSAWRQPATSNKGSESVRIFGGRLLDKDDPSNPHYEFDGLVTLKSTRYLHLDVDAILREQTSSSGGKYDSPADLGLLESSNNGRDRTAVYQIYRLMQSQRVRSNKLYYFDHPLMGVIVKISPYGS
jgi:hypothetical protein